MECPKCESDTYVIDSRKFAGTTYRRRKCKECGHKFYTSEEILENEQDIRYLWKYEKMKQRYKRN